METRTPKYRRDRRSNQAFVELSGRKVFLGEYDSEHSRAEYRRHVAEWRAAGADLWILHAGGETRNLTVEDIVLGFKQHCQSYYRTPDGEQTKEVECMHYALKPLLWLYGHTLAHEFGPLRLKAVRQEMIDCGRLCRKEINKRTQRVARCFRWASENELVPASMWDGLRSVSGLRFGRCGDVRESPRVLPVEEAKVEATLPFLSSTIQAMVRFQLATGCRPGEACLLRPCDIDQSGEVWIYQPRRHKTLHHGHERRIYIGQKGQEAIRELLFTLHVPTAYVFSPKRAMQAHRELLTACRKTPLSCGNKVGSNRKLKPKKTPGERYITQSYGRTIATACEKAFPHPTIRQAGPKLTPEQRDARREWRRKHHWHANQLRHTAASRLRREIGLEAARVVLGHRSAAVTEVYAEIDFAAAESAIARFG